MNTSPAISLSNEIDRHVSGFPARGTESHCLNSLACRIAAPVEVAEKYLSDGKLKAIGPVYARDTTGRHFFSSAALNSVRASVLREVVEKTIEESDGTPGQISFAAGESLRRHVISFGAKPKARFMRFPEGIIQFGDGGDDPTGRAEQAASKAEQIAQIHEKRAIRLELTRRLDAVRACTVNDEDVVKLSASQDDENPGPFQKAAIAAGKLAAVGGAAYGGAAYLRGRYVKPGAGLLDTLTAGARANNQTISNAAGTLAGSAEKVWTAIRGRKPIVP